MPANQTPVADDYHLIPLAEARAKLGNCSRAKVYVLMSSAPDFPKPVYIGRSLYFVEAELDAWVTSPARREMRARHGAQPRRAKFSQQAA